MMALSGAALAAMLSVVAAKASSTEPIGLVGDVRIQFLSPTLVRLELRGPKGFENRNTFTIVKRPRALSSIEQRQKGSTIVVSSGEIEVEVPDTKTLNGVTVTQKGHIVYKCDGTPPPPAFFPSPSAMPVAFAIADNPRIVPPKWGATAPPEKSRTLKATSGWDISNQSLDIYVFLPKSYTDLRKEFLQLTGPTEMPPLYNFGLWHSRYHPYTEQEALDVIDRYRQDDIPIDGFVVDTDWRVGASHGYATNAKLFPDMKRFIDEAHQRHVRLMYNDHPEPVAEGALDPKEMSYRQEGLASLLKMGVDVWWYDRNWSTHLHEPAPGLPKEVWGAAVFHDITQQVNPDKRPLIMSNVPGMDNGRRRYAPHSAAHRYPVWWTGDTRGIFDYLQNGVANAVDGGVESLLPYMSEDLGGHFGNPTPEVYARFMEYGALSPMMRLHCTAGETRDPWAFGEDAEEIVRKYAKLRYRLMPTIYSAARRNYEDGTPILRRCDLEWPQEKEASRNDQYLLGDDILVAPIMTSMEPQPVVIPSALLHTSSGAQGIQGDYFDNKELKGNPVVKRVDPQIDFDWGDAAAATGMPEDDFSIRWSGKLGPVPVSGDYRFVTVTDDGVRLYIDGKPIIDRFVDMDHERTVGTMHLDAGKTYDLRMEYFDSGGEAAAHLGWITPDVQTKDSVTRQVWIPPGKWMDLWSGKFVSGPAVIDVQTPLAATPMWERVGGLVLLAPDMWHTGERPWDEITVYACLPDKGSITRTLYEDDGISNDYKKKAFSKTTFTMSRKGNTVTIKISATKGVYTGIPKLRNWKMKLFAQDTIYSSEGSRGGKFARGTVGPGEGVGFPFKTEGDSWNGTIWEDDSGLIPTNEGYTLKLRLKRG